MYYNCCKCCRCCKCYPSVKKCCIDPCVKKCCIDPCVKKCCIEQCTKKCCIEPSSHYTKTEMSKTENACDRSGTLYGYVPVKLCYKLSANGKPVFPKDCSDSFLDSINLGSMSSSDNCGC